MLETIVAVIIGIWMAQALQFLFLTNTKLGNKFTTWLAKWSFERSVQMMERMEEFNK